MERRYSFCRTKTIKVFVYYEEVQKGDENGKEEKEDDDDRE